MSNTIIKKIEIQHPTTNVEVDIGAEAQSVTVSRDVSGTVIVDLDTEVVDSTESLAEALKRDESPFTGATSSANGTKGLVPQPLIADENKFLRGDGTWGESISGSSITITSLEASLNGKQVSISDGTHTKTGTFDSSGICTITGITFVGNLTITSTDGTETATKIVNMPYFGVYATTLSFWAATVNITGSDELKGVLVTVKNSSDVTVGTVTLSLTDATGVFVASEADTYSFKYTYNSKNYSEELEVTSQTTYNLSLSVGFDWQTWLDEGRISKSFSSLDDILEDEETLRQLMLVHDSVDYLASQSVDASIEKVFNCDLAAKWINLSDYALDTFYAVQAIKTVMDTADKYFYGEWVITDDTTTPATWGPKGAVPVMTANTSPYGKVSAQSEDSSAKAWRAFDGNDSTNYDAASGTTTGYLQYKFTNPTCVKKVEFKQEPNSMRVKGFTIRGSNDGSNFTDLYSGIAERVATSQFFEIDNDDYYLYYRMSVTSLYVQNRFGVTKLQFYGRQLSVSVPVMTSNTAPYGEVFANGQYSSNYAPWHAFDGVYQNASSQYDRWVCPGVPSTSNPFHIGYSYTASACIKKVVISNNSWSDTVKKRNVKDFKLQGSNDGTTWEDIGTTQQNANEGINTFTFASNTTSYKRHRILITSNHGGDDEVHIGELQFYGLDYSEKEFESGTTKKWLYDHGLELVEMATYASNSSCIAEKESDDIHIKTVSNQSAGTFNNSSIDLSNYNLVRAKFEPLTALSSGIVAVLEVSASRLTSTTWTAIASAALKADSKDNTGLDASNITQVAYIGLWNQSASGGVKFNVKELWVEQ